MKNVMLDLETLGTVPGCIVLSIGAVAFDPEADALGDEFYTVVSTPSCLSHGLRSSESTIEWWSRQSEKAQEVLRSAKHGGLHLEDALSDFTVYLVQFGLDKVRLWGNGSDFDNAILSTCYHAVNGEAPWSPWNNRCYRTLKNLIRGPKLKREGTYHNALDDAKSQALHAIQLLRQ